MAGQRYCAHAVRVLTIGSMYPPHHLGGYELIWRAAVEHLRARGDEVRVLASDFTLTEPDPSISEDPNLRRGLRWYWRDHEWPRLTPRERLSIERDNRRLLNAELDSFEPDIVAWWAMGGMSMSLVETVRRRGLAAVGFVHDDWIDYGPKVDQWLRLARRLGPAARAVELITRVPIEVDLSSAATWAFVSETTRGRARAALMNAPSSPVINSGVNRDVFRPAPEQPWGGRLLYVGRIDERKGVATAIEAVALLEEMSLTVVGNGDARYLSRLRLRVHELALGGRVRFESRSRAELASAYAAADAVLFPAIWDEPWGLVPLEAMATGRPVVATGAGGGGEYLHHEVNCLLFSPRDDHAALAEAIRRLSREPALRHRLREQGFVTAAQIDEHTFCISAAELLDQVASGELTSG